MTDSKFRRPAVVLFITSGPLKGQKIPFADRTVAVIGRGLDATVKLPDDEAYSSVSRHHALLDIQPPRVFIRDLGSLNGTHVGDRTIGQRTGLAPAGGAQDASPEYELKDGERFLLGQAAFGVRVIDPEAANRPRPTPDWICAHCDRSTAQGARRDHPQDYLCRDCKADPNAPLRVLTKGVRAGEPELASLRGLKVIRPLGAGSTGAAYLAQHKASGRLLALKLLFPEMAVNDWARESFLREVANTRNLDHPNVVRLYDSGSHKGVFFYTMEYCDGGSLEDLRLKRGGRLKAAEALPLILGALDGLEYIHQAPIGQVKLADGGIGEGRGLVHRDLKPANIFLHGSGEKAVAKIADVGVGKAFDMAGLSGQTRTGTVAGSPVVSPRQQVINFKYATPDVDVWAMAASLYILLAGTYPRDFDNNRDPWLVVLETNPAPIRQRNPNIPSGLADVIDRALIDNPQILFKTAAVLKQALLAAI